MKLSFLVDFLRQLETVPVSRIRQDNERRLQELTLRVCHHPVVKFDQFVDRLQRAKVMLNEQFDTIDAVVGDLRTHVESLIRDQDQLYRSRSLRWFLDEESQMATAENILNRRLALTADVRERLRASVAKSQDWRWPGMIIRPGMETFVDDMVALDPLYMIDSSTQLLAPAVSRYPASYQRRIQQYAVTEVPGQPILWQMPQAQFGFCFAFYFFNFRPIELVCQWLTELWGVLRPGGRLLFTYNDCDTAHGVGLAEQSFMAYTPGSAIRQHAQDLGFEIMEDFHAPADVNWLELRKPGDLSSIRGSQTLAKIVTKSK